MAYLPQSELDKEQEKKDQQGGELLSAAPAGLPGSAPTQKPKGSGFVNIKDYLNLNREQAAAKANAIMSPESKQVENLAGDIKNYGTKTSADIESAVNPLKETEVQQAVKNPGSASPAIKQAVSGNYTIPTYDVSSYQKRAGDLDTAAKTGMTQEGQANVIKSKANRPGYSQGQNRLDTALMGGTIGKGFSAITEALKPVTSSIDQWNTALANKVKAEGDQASANAKAVANAVNAKVASETKRLEDVAAAKNTYSPVPSTGGKVDASKYVQQSPMLASASNVAGVDDVAYMKALQELSGNQLPAYLDAGQAGTYQLPTFDTAGYNAAVQQQVSDQNKADYNAYIASLPKTNKQGSMITVAPTFEQWVTSPSKEVKQPDGTTKTVKTIKPTYRRGAK